MNTNTSLSKFVGNLFDYLTIKRDIQLVTINGRKSNFNTMEIMKYFSNYIKHVCNRFANYDLIRKHTWRFIFLNTDIHTDYSTNVYLHIYKQYNSLRYKKIVLENPTIRICKPLVFFITQINCLKVSMPGQ